MTNKQKQCLLCYMDCLPASGIDGIWGPQSAQATITAQRKLGIPDDGEWGNQTEEAVRSYIGGTKELAADTSPDSEETPDAGPLWWSEIKHFRRDEFACKCGLYHAPYCDGYPAEMREEVVRIADAAREHFGRPGHVISGLRCPQHNKDSDGVWSSQHQYGEACDLRIEGVSASQLMAFILDQPGVRYAYEINDTNVHYDIPQGVR